MSCRTYARSVSCRTDASSHCMGGGGDCTYAGIMSCRTDASSHCMGGGTVLTQESCLVVLMHRLIVWGGGTVLTQEACLVAIVEKTLLHLRKSVALMTWLYRLDNESCTISFIFINLDIKCDACVVVKCLRPCGTWKTRKSRLHPV